MDFRYNNKENLQNLAEKIRREQVLPFFGAGISAAIFPTWVKYMKCLIEPGDEKVNAYVHEQLEKTVCDYETVLQFLQEEYGRAFFDKTQAIFDSRKISQDKLDPAIFEFPRLFHGPMITTNLDQVLEWVYQKSGTPLTVGLAKETGFIQDRMVQAEPCLWKIHGDITKKDSWVLTKEQYDTLYRDTDDSFTELFSVFLKYKMLLFIGASLKSDKVVGLLENLFKHNPNICHYAIMEAPSDETTFINEQKRIWRLGVKPIWYTVKDNDYSEFYQILHELARLTGVRFCHSYLPAGISAQLAGTIGRNSELQQITSEFSRSAFVVLAGANGIGKTHLALRYSREVAQEDIIFLNCTSEENFQQSLYDFLKWNGSLFSDTVRIIPRDYPVLFSETLRDRSHYLVIFDNVTDDTLFDYIASLPESGHYLITTCRSNLSRKGMHVIKLHGLPDTEAYDLFLSRNPALQDKLNPDILSQLNHYCGGNPLLLEQAVAYITETGEDIEHYFHEIVQMEKKTKYGTDFKEPTSTCANTPK